MHYTCSLSMAARLAICSSASSSQIVHAIQMLNVIPLSGVPQRQTGQERGGL